MKATRKLVAFDAARYLRDDEAIVEYVAAFLQADNPELPRVALGDVVRARRTAQLNGGRELPAA